MSILSTQLRPWRSLCLTILQAATVLNPAASSGMIMSRYERYDYISGGYEWEIKNMRTNPIQQLENKIPGRQRKAVNERLSAGNLKV